MKPKFKKTRRKGDLDHPWEYRRWRINSGSRTMYHLTIWRAYRDQQPPIVSTNLNDLCVKIDLKEDKYENQN